ncbi:MAG: hypothetical protein ACTSQE_08125 [Candidatus Heimdallarchaeaceae archaeon]
MHVGFVIRKITEKEIEHKCIYIYAKDREIFPKPHVLFMLESYEETYGAYLDDDGFIRGLETWFDGYPHKPEDTIIIAKTSEGYSLSTSSELVQQIINETFEKLRVDHVASTSELCPNCQYQLEYMAKKEDRYVMKCARCGFTMVRKLTD